MREPLRHPAGSGYTIEYPCTSIGPFRIHNPTDPFPEAKTLQEREEWFRLHPEYSEPTPGPMPDHP